MGQFLYETLFSTKWLEIRRATTLTGEYIYSHSPWSNGNGVAVLPYKKMMAMDEQGELKPKVMFLGRFEICPAHSDETELCSITGGCDKPDELPLFTAIRELEEEGGYRVVKESVIPLGTVRGSKSSDNTTYLYAVNLDFPDTIQVPALGDGTAGEQGAWCSLVSSEDLVRCKDPYIHAMLTRLNFLLQGYTL